MRVIRTNPFPCPPVELETGMQVVTPHSAAADALGVARVSLVDLAGGVLKAAGFGVASGIEAFTDLKTAVSNVVPRSDTAALAVRIRTVLNTVLRTGISFEQLEMHGSVRTRQVAGIAREYEGLLNDRRLVDPSAVLWRATLLEPEPQQILIYGYFRARKEELTFINAFAGANSAYYLPCGNDSLFLTNNKAAEWFREIGGWHLDEQASPDQDTGTRAAAVFAACSGSALVNAVSLDNVESEARYVLGKVKELVVSGVDPHEVAIVAENGEIYGPLLVNTAEEYGMAVTSGLKASLAETRFGSLIEAMFSAIDTDFEFETAASVLMHPLGSGLGPAEWREARRLRIRGREEWARLSPDIASFAPPEVSKVGDGIKWLKNNLHMFGVRRKVRPSAREVIAYSRFMSALDSLEDLEPMDQAEFFTLIRELLATVRVTVNPARGGIPVHDLDTIQGARYKYLFVVGMAEGMLPPPVVESPVIDFHERARLTLHGIEFEEAETVARWSALSFYLALLSAEKGLTVSFPVSVENRVTLPSPYFARLGVEPTNVFADGVYSREEDLRLRLRSSSQEGTLERVRRQLRIELARESTTLADEYDGVIGISIDPYSRSWSASQFTAIGQCPFRWFSQKVLWLKEAEEADTSLSPAVRGSLYHKTLELAAATASAAGDVRSSMLAVLEDSFLEAEKDRDVALPALENWHLQRSEHLKALRKAIISPKFLEPGAEIVSLEEKFETVWQGIKITGRIDRVDRTDEGLIAIDYKTSSAAPQGVKDDAGKSKVDVQLSLYTQVALPHLYPGEMVTEGRYYSLTKGRFLKTLKAVETPPLEDFIEKIHTLLTTGSFAVDPDIDGHACRYCEFDAMCRKGARLSRKTRS